MKSLHLLINGDSLEDIKKNLDEAWQDMQSLYGTMGERANCLLGEKWEYEFVEAECMASLHSECPYGELY